MSFESNIYSNNLDLEDGLEIILPYVMKWSDDAILQKLMTNVVNEKGGFKANVYEFQSIKKKTTLLVTYNYKSPINEKTFSGFGNSESWENNNKFNFQEERWISPSAKDLKRMDNNLKQSNYHNIDNYLKSKKIIELAKKRRIR